MTDYPYPHQRSRILAISGIFDAFTDVDVSKVKWFETWKTGNMQWDVLSAPGGVGGNALWVKGTIGDTIGMQGKGHLSPYPNTSNQYLNPPATPFRIKNRAEFRMRIVQDQSSSGALLSHAAGFVLDGAVKWTDDHNINRTGIYFSVANQRVGISSGTTVTSEHDVAWAGAVDTWYNIRIEWEWDWFDNVLWTLTDWERDQTDKIGLANTCMKVFIKVYINNSLVIDHFIYKGEWRDTVNLDFPQSMDLGRAGIGVSCENDDPANVTNGTFVEAYFKDIWITQNIDSIDWNFTNSVIYKGAVREAKAVVLADFPDTITRGQDIQIHARKTTSDNWIGQFRGKIRSVSRGIGRIVNIGAEGYDSILFAEKSEAMSFTAKTAEQIIVDAVNVPDNKPIFDVSTFFDTATTTYNRDYPHLSKLDIMLEMATLEKFSLNLDMANAWHFEKYTNSRLFTNLHFEYGSFSGFSGYKDKDYFIRSPNIVRVIGSGVTAQKQIAAEHFTSGSTVIKEFVRLDITTQADADEALNYYIASYLEPYKVITIILNSEFVVIPGIFIKISIAELGYNYQFVYVLSVKGTLKGDLSVTVFSIKPDVTTIMADLNYRQGSTEGESFSQDLVADEINIEGVATLNISARFYITEFRGSPVSDEVVEREGKAVITNLFLDDLNDLFLTDTVGAQPAQYEYIHWGTGTTREQEDDTQIETGQDWEWIGPYRTNDGKRNWGNGVSAFAENNCTVFRIPRGNIGVGQTLSGITELTLQESTSTSSKTAVRCTFPAFTPSNANTQVEIIIAIFYTPQPGASYPTTNFLRYIGHWLQDLGIAFLKVERIALFGTDAFTYPSIWLEEESEGGGTVVTCPSLASQVSLTTTQLKDRFLIKYEQTYTFEYDDRYNSADGDQLVAWIGTVDADNGLSSTINIFFRTTKLLSDYDTWPTKIIIWLKFARQDLDIRKWLCTPRLEEGDCL